LSREHRKRCETNRDEVDHVGSRSGYRRKIGDQEVASQAPTRPSGFFAIAEAPMTGWLAVFAAGLFEIAWAFGLKYSDGLTRFWPTLATALAILASFALMAFALRSLPFGTAYAIWTGIGAAGSIVLGMVIFSEPTDPVRIICLTLIVAGVVGLKLTSPV
jgi:quaternary ammonium compound-resistance protein SugE